MTANSLKFTEDLQSRLSAYGLTPDGTNWILKALHPAGPSPYAAIPDDTYYKTARCELRTQTIVSAPGETTWDLFVWRFPMDSAPIVWGSQDASTGPYNGLNGASGNVVIQSLASSVNANRRLTLLTGALDTDNTTPVTLGLPVSAYTGFRYSYASLTCYLTASALTDQGTVFASQSAPACSFSEGAPGVNGTITSGQVYPIWTQYYTTQPYSESDMALMNPRYRTAPAREGVYMPFRLAGPTQPFGRMKTARMMKAFNFHSGFLSTPVDQIVELGSGSPLNVPSLIAPQVESSSDMAAAPQGATGGPPIDATSLTSYSTMSDNTNCGLVIFRGLDPKATVTLKYIAGCEYQADRTSSMQTFAAIPPRFDPRAMEAYYRVVQEMADAYPADWNSLGTILSAVSSVAGKIFPFVKPLLAQGLLMGAKALGAESGNTMGEQQKVVTPAVKAPVIREPREEVRIQRLPARSRSRSRSRVREEVDVKIKPAKRARRKRVRF